MFENHHASFLLMLEIKCDFKFINLNAFITFNHIKLTGAPDVLAPWRSVKNFEHPRDRTQSHNSTPETGLKVIIRCLKSL